MEPTADDALTVDQAIAQLGAVRQKWGGDTRLFMPDGEPVVRMGCDGGAPPVVTVTDRFQETADVE